MERKIFLKHAVGLLSTATLIDACKKDHDTGSSNNNNTSGCITTATEVEGPYPYPGGEITNPLNRTDITEGQAGVPLALTLKIVNSNNNCSTVENARVDIWYCNKDGYYSGYGNQTGGTLGTQNYVGQTWMRGYQTTDASGQVLFNGIYPGWYQGRATHIHFEVFVNGVLKKTGQIAFNEAVSDVVHVSALYAAHGTNTTRNSSDGIFNNSSTDLANETITPAGDVASGYAATYTIGVPL